MAEKLDTQVRREQIAQATLELVATGGLKKLSVAAVARRVGLVPSALYRHFKSKDEVLDATLELIQDKLLDNVRAVRDETDDAMEQLRGLLMRHMRMIRENRGIPQIIFSQDAYVRHPERRNQMYLGIRRYLVELARTIRRGQEVGQVGSDVDADAAAVIFLGLVMPSVVLWRLSDGDFDVTRQAQRAWPLFLKAIQGAAETSPGKSTAGRAGERE